ncbi:MAG: Holliday junction resolvase RuvX [Eubacteriaceae bacterium]|nr:Holliday junction resolvase RuvX [Eubacteriaceae bacterium]MBR2781503.1 Holliday junction resolvase RuvX [Eubacteriaceae bacterium]MCR4894020.1 Holliday junction resolvase RuvX [Eubacteriales bacterium]
MLDKRIMCLDLGGSRTGVAVSDIMGMTAQGAGVIRVKGFEEDLKEYRKIIEEKNVGKLIIGYPLNLDGTEGEKAASVRAQYEKIRDALDGIEVILWDERLSTKEAERAFAETGKNWKKKREVIDEMAAQIILQSYLDSNIF